MDDTFFQKVYEVARLVPRGRVTTYGAIARYLGTGQSARVVGWAMNSSFSKEEFVPAHRVVNRDGVLTGKHHFGTSGIMAQLLRNEGINITDDRIVNFKTCFWDPNKEL
jgi:methylated-DNA-protein-cysteine methyltransferase-like protein